jgi:hypothetical protein
MTQKLIDTVRFGSGLLVHAIGKDGYTQCSIWLYGTIGKSWRRTLERRPSSDVTCWLCRKQGAFLRPKPGTCLTATMRGLKIHRIKGATKGRRPKRLETPCNLDFTSHAGAAIRTRPHAEVNCGHCMRFSFR